MDGCFPGLMRLTFVLLFPMTLFAQHAEIRPADPIILPGMTDSNSPAHWIDDNFSIIQSFGLPLISQITDGSGVLKARVVGLNSYAHSPLWIESTWVDDNNVVYAWYHHEKHVCDGRLAMPMIGALVSYDGGSSFSDLGIIMESANWPNCNAENGYFAGGNGDFTVLLDSSREYFYFYFTNYNGPLQNQGIGVARMAFADRAGPVGRVWKYYAGDWKEPARFGRVSAIMPARESWVSPNTDSFWGPSLHWNTFLDQYVMLLNNACCEPGWPSEGIYISYNPDLGNPEGWTTPLKILGEDQAGWYPQVIGYDPGMTDKLAGETARLFIKGESHWEIVFGYE